MFKITSLTNQCAKIAQTITSSVPRGQTIHYLSNSKLSLSKELSKTLPNLQGQNASDVFVLLGANNSQISILQKLFEQLKKTKNETEILHYLEKNPYLKTMYQTYSQNGLTSLADAVILHSNQNIGKFGIQKTTKQQSAFNKWLSKIVSKKTNLSEELAKNYEKIALAKTEPKAQKIYSQFANQARNGEFKGEELYRKFLDSRYQLLRVAEYSPKTVAPNIETTTETATSKIRVKNQNGWHYRCLKGHSSPKANWRISINANANSNLISELDKFVTSDCYYKTPDQIAGWLTRHDPITIYFKDKPTQVQIDNLIQIMQKTNGIRSTKAVLPGQTIIPGMVIQTSPSQKDINFVLAQAEKISPDCKNAVKNYLLNQTTKELKASAGQLQVIKDLLSLT